jgi:hypothetical protein
MFGHYSIASKVEFLFGAFHISRPKQKKHSNKWMSKIICLLKMKGVNVWFKHIKIVYVLELKIYLYCSIFSTLQKDFIKL